MLIIYHNSIVFYMDLYTFYAGNGHPPGPPGLGLGHGGAVGPGSVGPDGPKGPGLPVLDGNCILLL